MRILILKRVLSFTLCSVLALFVLGNPCLALDPGVAISQYTFDMWTTKEGLPHNWVDSLLQTRNGYIWLGTSIGLVRFDGVRFTLFDKNNTQGIRGNNMVHLFESKDGTLWIGTLGSGLTSLKDGQFRTFTTEDGLSDNTVLSIQEDSDGVLWVGTRKGVARLKNGKWSNLTVRDGLSGHLVYWISAGPDKSLWMGTNNGLSQWKSGRFQPLTEEYRGIPIHETGGVYWDRSGAMWISTDDGVRLIRDGRVIDFGDKHGVTESVSVFLEDRDGNLWMAMKNLYRYRDGKFTKFTSEKDFFRPGISSLVEDHEGSIWITILGTGIARLKDSKLITYTSKEAPINDYVWGLHEDSQGGVWIGNTRFYNGQFTRFRQGEGGTLTSAKDGSLWFFQGIVSQFRNGEMRRLSDLRLNSRASYTDRQGRIWLGMSGGGLAKFEDERLEYIMPDGKIPQSDIVCFTESRDGTLWIGTFGSGLLSLKDGHIRQFTSRDGLTHEVIESLYADMENNLWIGTNGGGLNRLRDGKFTAYTSKQGMFDDVAFTILEDDKKNLWMGSERGVYRVSKEQFDLIDSGKIRTLVSVSFGTPDGMKSTNVVGHTQHAGLRTRDGRLWFGTVKGVSVIDPNNIKLNRVPPPVYIDSAVINKKSLVLNRRNEINPGSGELEFSFSVLSFLVPERVKVRYRLDGFDKEWIDAEGRREARYTNIPPGEYRFNVIASNDDGVWSTQAASLDFYLRPRFYQTYWFMAISLFGLILIAWSIYKLRMRQVEAQFSLVLAERNRIARDLHDTLLQGLVGIGMQLEAVSASVLESPEKAKRILDHIVIQVGDSISAARRSVWNLRSKALDSSDLASAISAYSTRVSEKSNIKVHFQVIGTPGDLSPKLENNLLYIAQEAITNAVKYSGCRNIWVELGYESKFLHLFVRDDGTGFKMPSGENGHFGLIGMHERVSEEGGKIEIASENGQGTEVSVLVPK
jgi:signal transduction histidine kinase/ligand-binding sensor domain-containing protein